MKVHVMDQDGIDFLNYLLIDRKYSQNTISSYDLQLHELETAIKKTLRSIQKEEIYSFLQQRKKTNSPRTIAHFMTVFRSFYKFS